MERPRAQVQVGVTAAGGAAQGSVLGYGLGVMNKSLEAQAANMPNKPPMAAQGSFSGPPKVLALNLAVFSAVQGGLTLAIKKPVMSDKLHLTSSWVMLLSVKRHGSVTVSQV